MGKFNIGDEVRDTSTNESGTVTDRMYSEAKGKFLFVIKPHSGGRSFVRPEDEIELFLKPTEYKIKTDIADNVVVVIISEVRAGNEVEVCRGHGHIIHDGAEGIAQALSYASRRAFGSIDSGIYFKQKRES